MKKKLPKPACEYGYTSGQLRRIFPTGADRVAFFNWMMGQTGAICPGELPCKRKHGFITYVHDVYRFLENR